MRFLCDHMLGTLAKWLRFLGYDTAYPGPLDDGDLLRLAATEGRVLLTRDKELAGRAEHTLLIRSDELDEQLREVGARFPLGVEGALTRCSLCNIRIQEATPAEVEGEVPEGVLERHREFWRCPHCRRVYWKGTHYDRMVQRIEELKVRPSGKA